MQDRAQLPAVDRRTLLKGGAGLGLSLPAAGLAAGTSAAAEVCPALPATVPYRGRFYGCMAGGDYHTNRFVSWNNDISIRFVAEETGSIKSFRWQCRHDGVPPPVYDNGFHSVGWGGQVTVTLRRDRGDGTPDMSSAGFVAATRVNNGGSTPLVLRKQEVTWSFIRPGRVVCGRTYHLVFRNTHPTDFISINANFNWLTIPSEDPSGPGGPYYRSDWSYLTRARGQPWVDLRALPFVTFAYTNGVGIGISQDWIDMASVHPIDATKWVRQAFTVRDATYRADCLWFRAWSTDGVGELVVRLVDGSGATVVESAMPAGSLPVGDRKQIVVPWTRLDLGFVELRRDSFYALTFLGEGGASCAITAIRDGGVGQGFVSRNRWLSSRAETSVDAGATWIGWMIPGKSKTPRSDMMLPAGFGLVPA